MRINREFLVFPLIHHATTSSDHNSTFYPIQILPNSSNSALLLYLSQVCFDLSVCCCSLVQMISTDVLGEILRSSKYFSVSVLAFCIPTLSTFSGASRAKRASGAPSVSKSTYSRKFGYHVTVYRPSVRTTGKPMFNFTLSSSSGSIGKLILHTYCPSML